MSEYNAMNYTEQGGDVTHIGGTVDFDGVLDFSSGQIEGSIVHGWIDGYTPEADSVEELRKDFNKLLEMLKFGHVLERDRFNLLFSTTLNDTVSDHANRQYNSTKVSAATCENYGGSNIVITLSEKVENLRDYDASDGEPHKWFGIGIKQMYETSIAYRLKLNGKWLTPEDEQEATSVGLDKGYFVLWIAADEVIAGKNNTFTLEGLSYWKTEFVLHIQEPGD